MYDLICNLHHLADVDGVDWDEVLRMSDLHYKAEVEEAHDIYVE
jgi:hypothetical protein